MPAFGKAITAVEQALTTVERTCTTRRAARATRARAVEVREYTHMLLRPRVAMKPFSGGSGGPESDAGIRARLGRLIEAGQLPKAAPTKVWAGPSLGGAQCTGCGASFAVAETEYETTMGAVVLLLHLHCLELWASEAERRTDIADMIKARIVLGELPSSSPQLISVGVGNGEDCSACGRRMSRLDVQYNFTATGRHFRLHPKCLETWHDQRGQLGLT